FLLTTDLTDEEIVLGKLLARLATLALLLLTGLPVLSLMELWGGIDPLLVITGFLVTAMTLLAVGSLCILVSIHATGYLKAVFLSYLHLALLAFLVLSITSICKEVLERQARLRQSAVLPILMSVSVLVLGATAVGFCRTAVSQFRNAALPK